MDFEPMKPPDGLVDKMMDDCLSSAWEICSKVIRYKDSLCCGITLKQCFVFQDGKDCKSNPRNSEVK